MKKILALLLTLCMLAALVACGAEPATTVPTAANPFALSPVVSKV